MNYQAQNPNTLTPIDGFSDIDPTSSPLKGTTIRFKDGSYYSFEDEIETEGRTFAAYDLRGGWQKLEEGVPPEYLMREPGKPKPAQPHVDEVDWPTNLNGKPENPWRWTFYLFLIDVNSGEALTFSSSTVGGTKGVIELRDQIDFMRRYRANAIPIISLDSKMMPTQFGSKVPRPYFKLHGWKSHGDEQTLLTHEAPLVDIEKPSLKEGMKDEVPFNDPLPANLGAKANHKKTGGRASK
jgi:hypothetical protein